MRHARFGQASTNRQRVCRGARGPQRRPKGGSGPVLGAEVLVLHLPRMVEGVVGGVSDEKR
jgi:hypothetical protein